MNSRLSPEARARLEAARAIAQGKPAPTPVAPAASRGGPSAPGRSALATADAAAKDAVPDAVPDRPGTRGSYVLAAVVGLVALGGLAFVAGRLAGSGPDLLGSTAALQKGLLEGRVDAAASRKAVSDVIRNADQMTKQELDQARKSLEEEWQRARDEAIVAFFDAPEGERSRLADEGIDRTLAYRKLRFGLSPQAVNDGGRRQRPPKDGDRRKLFTRYAEALQAQAKKRGIALPEWQ